MIYKPAILVQWIHLSNPTASSQMLVSAKCRLVVFFIISSLHFWKGILTFTCLLQWFLFYHLFCCYLCFLSYLCYHYYLCYFCYDCYCHCVLLISWTPTCWINFLLLNIIFNYPRISREVWRTSNMLEMN